MSTTATQASAASQILFVDDSLANYQQIVGSAPAGDTVVVIDGGRDGIAQITDYLSKTSNVGAVHIVSHGADGELDIGTSDVTADNLGQYASQIASWKAALAPGADILLYGCSIAADGAGQQFVDQIAGLTGATVAASTDNTGAAASGGNWNLEYATGKVAVPVLDDPGYDGLLSHFRAASLTWTPGSGNTINLAMQMSFRTDFGWTDVTTGKSNVTAPAVGDILNQGSLMYFGDGSSATIYMKVAAISTTQDYFVANLVTATGAPVTHTYANAGAYTAYWTSSARLGTLSNFANDSWRTQTLIDVGAGNSPPVSALPPIVQVAKGQLDTFQIPVTDPNGDQLSFAIGTGAQFDPSQSAATLIAPAGVTLSASGLLTWDLSKSPSVTAGQQYVMTVTVSDLDGTGKVKSTTPLDFILQVVDTTTSKPPTFTLVPQTQTAIAGILDAQEVTATDPQGALTNIQVLNPPAGFATEYHATEGELHLNFTPTKAEIGTSSVVSIQAIDNIGLTAQTSVTYNVISPAPVVTYQTSTAVQGTATVVIGTVQAAQAGDALAITQAQDTYGTVSLGAAANGVQQILYTGTGVALLPTVDHPVFTITDMTLARQIVDPTISAATTTTGTVQIAGRPAPIVTLGTPSAIEGMQSVVLGTVVATQLGDVLAVTQSAGAHGTVSLGTAVNGVQQILYTGTGTATQSTLDQVSYTITDTTLATQLAGTAGSVATAGSGSVQIDGGPVLSGAASGFVPYNGTAVIGTVAPGVAGDVLSVTGTSPAGGTFALGVPDASGNRPVIYTGPAAAQSADTVSYTVVDQHGLLAVGGSATLVPVASTGVPSVKAVADLIIAISQASQSTGGQGTAFSITLPAGTSLSGAASSTLNLATGDTLTIRGDNATLQGGGVILQGAGTLHLSSSGGNTLTIAEGVSGSGGLTIDGGNVVLQAANSYTGDTFVNGGSVVVSGSGALGTGTVHLVDPSIEFQAGGTSMNAISLDSADPTTDPNTFTVDGGVTETISGAITTGTGTNDQGRTIDPNQIVRVTGPGTLILTNPNDSWSGGTVIDGGATLQIGDGTATGGLNGDVVDNATLTFDPGAAGGTYAGNVSGSGIVTKTGAGAETLTGASTNADDYVSAGTLTLASTASLTTGGGGIPNGGRTSAVGVAAGATLNNAGTITITDGGANSSNGIDVQGGTFNNSGTLTGSVYQGVIVQGGGTVTNTGSISGGNGILSYDAPGALTVTGGGSITGTNGQGIDATRGGAFDVTLGTAGAGALGTVAGAQSGILAQTAGAGAISIVTGADVTGSGGTGISAFASGSGVISVTASGGTIRAAGDGIDATSNGAGAIVVNQSGGQIGTTGAPVGGYGIFAVNNGGGTVSVTAGTIVSSNQGVVAITSASGDVTVATQGNITAGGPLAVNAQVNGGDGDVVVTTAAGTTLSANDVNDQNHFVVNAQHDGSGTGTVQVTNAATLTRPNGVAGGVAIRALNGTSGMLNGAQTAVSVTNSGTVTDSFATGISAQATGAGAVAVSNSGSIGGANTGTGISVAGAAASNIVSNSGTVSGAVGLEVNGGTTTLNNSGGTITGTTAAIRIDAGTLSVGDAIGAINGAIADAGALVLTNTGAIAIAGAITGAGTVTQAGTGTTTLTGNNGFSGGTSLVAGTLQVGDGTSTSSGASLGTGAVTDNAALVLNRTGNTTFSNNVSGSGSLTVKGVGTGNTETLTGALTQSGGFTVADASNVTIAAAGSYNGPSALTTNGGTLTVLGTVTTTNDQGIVTQNGGVVTVANGGSVTGYDTGVNASGTAATTVNNSGTIVGTHYSGAGQDTVTADFTLNNLASGTVVGNTNGVADGTGGKLTVSNAGTIVGGNYGASGTSATDTVVNSGTIASGSYNGTNGAITVGGTDGVLLSAGGTVTNKAGGLIEGALHGVEADANALNLSNAGTITSVGNDTVFATGANATVLNTGTIAASSTSAVVGTTGLAVTNAAGGILTGGTNGAYGYAVQLAGDSGTFDNYGTATGTAGGVLANPNLSGGSGVSLRLFAGSDTGAIKLDDVANNVSVYTGAAGAAEVDGIDPVTGAAVVLRAASSYGAAVVGDIALGNGGSVLNLRGTGDGTAANGAAGAISGVVSGSASVVKLDSGTFVLSGANTYTGGTSLVGGTLDLATATAAGTGAVTFANAAPGATLAIEKSALNGNAHFADTVGSFAIGDTLDLRGIGLASTARVDGNGLLTVGNGAGVLETIQLADLQSGDAFVLSNDGMGGTTVTLTSLSAAGGLHVGGTGTLVLGSSQAGAVAGPVHDDGTLAFDGPGGFTFGADVDGSGQIVVSGIAAGSTATFSGALTQSGGFTVADASNVVLTGSASGAGGTTISGGTLQVGDGTATGLLGGNVVDNGTLAFDPGTTNGSFAGNVSGSGIVAKVGPGTETLTGTLTEGGLNVQGGTLALGATATLATAGTAGLAAGGSGSQNQAAVAVTNGATFSNAGTVSAGNQGVLLQNGAFTNTGRISAPNQSGVFAASGAVTVANTGTGAISGANGIDANLTTADAISVTGNGSFTGTNGFGLRGISQGGNVTLGTQVAALGTVTGAGNGLIAQTNGVGAISIVTGADVTGSGGAGISATASGSGAVSVSANGGTVTGGNGDGIDATTSGTGAVSVTTAANETILATGNGITASSTGAGTPKNADGSTATDVSVTNAGAIRHMAASGNGSSSGISANTAGAGFLAVANGGAIGTTGPAFANGIVATRSNATADVTVTNSGAIGAAGDAVTGTGILAFTQGGGNASVGVSNTAAITSSGTGIDATDTGNGNVRVTGNGAIVAGAIGVRVTETGNGGAFVGTPYNDGSALGAITAGGTGIAASTTGGGGITVYSGAVTSSGGSGIVASVTGGTGAIAVTTRGNVSGAQDGISVAGGSASNIVTNAFTVSGAIGLEVNGGTTTLINNGVIASTAAGGNALQVDSGTLVLGDSIGTVTGNIGLQGSGSTLVLSGSGPQTIANAITGAGVLSKTGTGTTTLSGASTFTGGTSLVAGTLDLATATAAGTGAITFANAAGQPGATLAIEKSALDGNARFADTVGSFAIGDTLDLRGIGLASTASVDANGVLTIGNGAGALETIQLANLQSGDGFVLTSDGLGGTKVTLVADAGPTIAAVTPVAIEKGQTTVVGIVTPGVLTDPETLTQTSGAGTLTLGAARADGSRQVLYTAPQGIASSKLDAVTYTVANQNGTTASGAASVQLDAGATIATAAPAVVEKGQQTVVGTVKAGLTGDTLTLTQTAGSGTLTLGAVQKDGTQQVLYTAPATVAVSGIDKVAYTVADQHADVVASGSNGVQLDAGATIATAAPAVVEKGQQTVVGTVTPGIVGDTLTLIQTAGSGTLTLGAVQKDGTQQVLYTAPATVAASGIDKVAYTVADQHADVVASGSNSVQLDAGATIATAAPAVVEKGQQTIIGTVTPGIVGDTLTLTQTAGSGTLTLGAMQKDGTQQVIYTAPASIGTSGIDKVAYTVADQHKIVVASGSNGVQLDAGATIATTAPAVVEKGQQTVVGTVMPGIVGDTLTLTQTAGSGTLTLGAVQKDGTQQVLYTAPATVAVSGIDKVSYTVADQHKIVVATGSNGVQLDAGATIATAAPAVVEKGQQTVVGTVTPGLAGDTLTLTQTAGSGTLSLGAVQKDGTQQVIYTAPATVAASGIDKVSYTVADQHADVVASGANNVQLDAGATIAASVPTKVGHGQTVTIGTVTPGLSGDTLTLAQTKGSGTLSLVNGAIRYTAPNAVTAGQSDGVAYTVRDQHQDATAAASANIVLDPGPTAASTTLTVGHNQVLDVTSLVNGLVKVGLAGDVEAITSLTATKGSATIGANGKLTYASAAAGSDTLAYTATDQLGDAASGTVTVTVDGGPTLTGVASTAKLGQSVNLTSTVLAAATPGLKGDVLTITGDTTSGTAGTVSLNNGVLTYTASGAGLSHIPANGSQTDSFVYTVSDQYGDTASATAKVTVTNPATVINGPFFGFSTIQGTTGTDIINAYGFFNAIASNGGNDVINAGLGNASVTTGSGDVVTNLQGFFDTVSGGDGWNTVSGSAGNATVTLGNGNDTVNTGGYFNTIKLGNGNDAVVAGQGGACVTLGSGQDSVTLAGCSNSVVAGDGNDVVKGGDGLATVTLGNGNDTVALGGWSNTIKVGSGSNAIVAGSGLAVVIAGAGTDVVTLAGTCNSVTLNGSTATVSGGQGNDTVTVNGGTDALTFAGWYDHAVLNGTAAASIMDLGNALRIDIGSSTQTDTITNFGSKDTSGIVDLLNGAGGYGSVSSIMNALHDDGHGGTMLTLGTTGSIDFAGTSKNQLHASNFKIG